MPKTNNSAGQDIFAAAERVYTILTKHNIDACTIGSMAIAHTTKKAFGRDPNVSQSPLHYFSAWLTIVFAVVGLCDFPATS